jgi:hypothetical protein
MANYSIHGIDAYPDLAKRFQAELRMATPSCSSCASTKIVRKYKMLLDQRVKKNSRIR